MAGYPKNAKIVYRKDINEEHAIFRIAPESGQVPEFTPGQYAELALPTAEQECPPEGVKPGKLVRRSYSIGSAPNCKDYLEFYIVLVPGGVFTPSLWQMKEGDRLWLGPKIKGKFTLDPIPDGKDLILVSTGTGLAPYIAMLKEYQNQGRWRRIVIVHGTRQAKDLGYREELTQIAESDAKFTYIPMATREAEDSDWTGLRGRVTKLFENSAAFEAIVGFPLKTEDCQVFLCGNPAMIDSVQQQLENLGFKAHSKKAPGNLHFERYW